MMLRSVVLSAAFALGLTSVANAAISPMPVGGGEVAIVKIAEGCGAGWWRGPGGYCHPFGGPGGSLRGTAFACPPGMHVGPYGHRCWPN